MKKAAKVYEKSIATAETATRQAGRVGMNRHIGERCDGERGKEHGVTEQQCWTHWHTNTYLASTPHTNPLHFALLLDQNQ